MNELMEVMSDEDIQLAVRLLEKSEAELTESPKYYMRAVKYVNNGGEYEFEVEYGSTVFRRAFLKQPTDDLQRLAKRFLDYLDDKLVEQLVGTGPETYRDYAETKDELSQKESELLDEFY